MAGGRILFFMYQAEAKGLEMWYSGWAALGMSVHVARWLVV